MGDAKGRLRSLAPVDQLVVGCLLLFMVVFAGELWLLIPCGGWTHLSACPAVAENALWAPYFKIDPFWSDMPNWYAAVMYLQDFVYNPFWLLSLAMYLLHRQGTAWFRTATVYISGMILATSTVVYVAQMTDPAITAKRLALLFVINSPWALLPLFFVVRMYRSNPKEVSR